MVVMLRKESQIQRLPSTYAHLVYSNSNAKISSLKNNQANQVDAVENMTVKIFTDLHCFADRMGREDIERAITEDSDFNSNSYTSIKKDSSTIQKSSISIHRPHPFRKETYFFDREDPEQRVRTKYIIYKIFSAIANIFLGCEFLSSNQDLRTPKEMLLDLKKDTSIWSWELKHYYKSALDTRMMNAFRLAEELLTSRENYAREARQQRLILSISLIGAIAGSFFNQKICKFFGLTIGCVNLTFMLTQYGKNSLKIAKLTADLKKSVEFAEQEAGQYRLTTSTSVTSNNMSSLF